jgi:hypothetical protein
VEFTIDAAPGANYGITDRLRLPAEKSGVSLLLHPVQEAIVENSLIQIVAAVVMLIVAAALVFSGRRYQVRTSEQRLRRMIETTGLDPEIASSGDLELIMDEVRQRCRQCQSEGLCERWLVGEEVGSNEFCPNSRVFEILRKYSPGTSR